MRVGILTFLHNENYGSILQAWALRQALTGLGVDAVHLDYCPDSREKLRNLVRSGNSPALLVEGLRKRGVKAGQEGARRKAAAFADFRREQLRLSAPCRDGAALAAAAQDCDALISGSDQIWSPVWLNPVYYLSFAENRRLLAYAPSFGVERIDSAGKAKRIAALLSRYEAVSVRERQGAELVQRLTGTLPPVMPDPVFLLSREDWMRFAAPPERKEPYLACYFIGNRPAYWDRVKELSDRLGLSVLVIPVTEEAYASGYPLAAGLSPQEWVGLLAGAAHILTDSFHGAAFSALLGRQATVLRRYEDGDVESKNSRIDNLFRELGLSGREEVWPWERIDARLEEMRLRGTGWLRERL